jgi:Ca-activated chloride channel homolog
MTAWLYDFHFLRPLWLLVIPFAILIYLAHSFREDIRARWRNVIAPELLEHLIVKKTGRWTVRPIHMILLGLVLSGIALAGPTWHREKPPFTEDKAPLVVAVDLSQTMDAIDLDPTRLERAKLKIHDLLKVRNGAPTALFAYAGSAHLVVPLTADDQLFFMYLDALSTSIMPKRGKNTAQALAAVQDLLSQVDVPGTVLFVTDGIEPSSHPALQKFLDSGKNSILVLGVGTSRGGPVRASANQFVEDSSGRRLFSKLDVDALESLGSIGVPATTLTLDNTDVEWIQRRVQSHLQTALEKNTQTQWVDEGYWLLIPIAALAALWFRKGWTVQWSRAAFAFLIFFPLPTADDLRHRFLDLWLTPDQQGRYYFEKGNYAVAADRFADPMWRGITFTYTGDYNAALNQFALAETPEAWYNQGNALAHLYKLPEAVHAYEQALHLRPDWREAQDNLKLVRSLIPPPKKDEEQEEAPPTPERGDTTQEEKGKKGKEVMQQARMDPEKMADIWMRNIQTSPADFLRRRFAIQADESVTKPPATTPTPTNRKSQ